MSDFKHDTDPLAATDAAQARLADRMRWPLWRHAVAGALFALILFAIAMPAKGGIAVMGLVVILIFAIIRDDKKRYGMFVSGYQRGRTGWVLAVNLVIFAAAWAAIAKTGPHTIGDILPWVLIGAVFVATTALSYLWEIVYRADLRKDRA